MKELNKKHVQLLDLITESEPKFVGFKIQKILKMDEAQTIANGIKSLGVISLDETQHQGEVLGFWSKYYKEDGISTLFVERMPGLVAVSNRKQDIRKVINQLNSLKIQIATIVRNDRNHMQRHEFIHDVFPRIMTDQLYRKIHIIENHVQRAWFNWTSRPIPKLLNKEEAISFLKKYDSNPLGLTTGKEWSAMISAQLEDILNDVYSHIYLKKDFRLLPALTYKEDVGDEIYKRKTKNGCSPIILLGQSSDSLPHFTHLRNYEKLILDCSALSNNSSSKVYINSHLKLMGTIKHIK
jgi:hypothetical protein